MKIIDKIQILEDIVLTDIVGGKKKTAKKKKAPKK